MDYHVFVVSRIHEAHDAGAPTQEAVARGIRSTAGVVTSAAIIMGAVFGVLATLSMQDFKQMGIGLGVAILLDATVVRGVLLPSVLSLLGERTWYLPRRLSLPSWHTESFLAHRTGARRHPTADRAPEPENGRGPRTGPPRDRQELRPRPRPRRCDRSAPETRSPPLTGPTHMPPRTRVGATSTSSRSWSLRPPGKGPLGPECEPVGSCALPRNGVG
ncbi:MMPL domain protein [Actinobacteria bacterium OK074]|nr:MMPL domain protein [Actinobacteria bacterium OK074]